jgi:hypothetical protein
MLVSVGASVCASNILVLMVDISDVVTPCSEDLSQTETAASPSNFASTSQPVGSA